jgi:hypothetical protein
LLGSGASEERQCRPDVAGALAALALLGLLLGPGLRGLVGRALRRSPFLGNLFGGLLGCLLLRDLLGSGL